MSSRLFSGEYDCTLDDKGRLSIPSKIREILSEKYNCRLMLSRWFDGCLVLFPYEEWVKLADKLMNNISLSDERGRKLQRAFFSGAVECSLDRQGRLTIPLRQKQMANIDKHVVLIGVANKIEIWPRDKYDLDEESLEELAKAIDGLQL